MRVDLHLHTTASDGSMSPAKVVAWAKKSGLDVVAITDHDTVSGLDEAIHRGKEIGIKVLPGIEISAYSKCEIHILGYNIDYTNPGFLEELENIKRMRRDRNMLIGERLSALGIELGVNFADDGVGRMNLARVMVDKGFAKDIKEAFDKYLGVAGMAYVAARRTLPFEAVQIITKYGGIAVLAHPKKYCMDRELELLISGLIPFGLKGLEVFYPSHTAHETEILKFVANKHKLILTGGSDFHGDEDKDFSVELPEATAKALKL